MFYHSLINGRHKNSVIQDWVHESQKTPKVSFPTIGGEVVKSTIFGYAPTNGGQSYLKVALATVQAKRPSFMASMRYEQHFPTIVWHWWWYGNTSLHSIQTHFLPQKVFFFFFEGDLAFIQKRLRFLIDIRSDGRKCIAHVHHNYYFPMYCCVLTLLSLDFILYAMFLSLFCLQTESKVYWNQ